MASLREHAPRLLAARSLVAASGLVRGPKSPGPAAHRLPFLDKDEEVITMASVVIDAILRGRASS